MHAQVISKENLFAAWREFQRGKMRKADVLAFAADCEAHLLDLHADLARGTYRHGPYDHFLVHDPKQRHIAKASVRDRVLHHAVCRILVPLFDPGFIFDSYASRKGKGTHAAVDRLERLAARLSRNGTRTVWMLKCDIRKFFDSIDHTVVLRLCARKIKDPQMLRLLRDIVDSYHAAPGKGIPLGNLTSQLLANVYLNPLDQYVKRGLRVKDYVRYTDDFVLLSADRACLERALPQVSSFLADKLALELHPRKVFFEQWRRGVDFLGYVSFPAFRIVRTRTKKRMLKRLLLRAAEARSGLVSDRAVTDARHSYLGVLSHARSRGLTRAVNRLVRAETARPNPSFS